MDRDNNVKRETSPRDKANFLSLITFFYTIKLYIKGYTAGLELNDIYEIAPRSHSKQVGEKLELEWQREKERRKSPSICRALWFCYGKILLSIGLVQFITTMIMTIWSPKALSKLISYFSPGQTDLTKQNAIYYACLVIGLNLTNSLIRHNFRLILAHLAVAAKAAVSSLLYRKALRLTSESLSKVSAGKIVTIITKDVDVFEAFAGSGNQVWIAVIQTGVICFLVYRQLGIASVSGIIFFLIVLPLQIFIGVLTYKYKLKCSKKTDQRLDLIREILAASKIIKMYTWEKFFETKIHEARKEELKKLHKIFYANLWIKVIGNICSKTSFFLFLMTYVWTGHNMSAEIVYYILSCSNDLESSLSNDLPNGLAIIAQLFATAKRIESVLEAPELPPKEKLIKDEHPNIAFNEVDVQIHETKILKNICLRINEGLNTVVGHTGSGKTSFLRAILQECQTSGDITIKGRISYASQEPWLFPSTIKNNILFGEEYNKERYHKVLKVCSLQYDLEFLSEGDDTVIGESGVNLSKGQQARINLARAVYKDSEIYLLDDPLASLDANVSDAIFEQCICEFLNKKICIFVTNNFDHVQKANKIIIVDSNSVRIDDSFESIKESEGQFGTKNPIEDNLEQENKFVNKEIYHETKNSGKVPLKDYLRYIQYGGGLVVFFLIVGMFLLAQSTSNYSDKLLSKWVTLEQNVTNYQVLNETDDPQYDGLCNERTHELSLYAVMVATSILLTLIKSFSFFHFIRIASATLHKVMVRNVINSTMKFFDSHFIGNVINRFTKDYVTLDDTLPFVVMDCFTMIFTAAGGIALLTSVNYIFFLESLLLIVAACVIKQFCQPTGRNLERLHVIARSPLTGHLSSTLEGLTTIRANNAQEIVTFEFDRHQNLFTSALFMVITNFIALSVFIKYVCTIFTGFVIFQFLVTDLGISVGDVGLAITQAFVITNIISSGIINVADCENLMISIERILEYTELEEEDKSGRVLIGWPQHGSINFSHLSLNYGNNQMLSDVSFVINPKERIGIVGRTGAGKSSIISSLFRLYPTKGTITIDGIDIKDVSLVWLRSNISVIPQDPYLFPVTIRENLDPLKQYKDEQIWKVLKELQLSHLIDHLNMKVDKGSTFSSGQKQLLWLSRAILRKSKIVILDEVTANVDQETDDLIQRAIQNHFKESTLITIAHKSQSILKCDKVLVLDKGRISEFGEPIRLLDSKISFLNSIVK